MRNATRAGLVLAALALARCSDPVTADDIVGVYQVSEFTITLNGALTDLVAKGATGTLELKTGGATSGHFSIPVIPGIQTTAVDDDLTGTYTINNGVVHLTQVGDSYIGAFLFVAADGQLRANQVINSPTVTGSLRLVLSK